MAVLSRALVAFDERRADPTVNLGTLGAAGNVTYTGTVRLADATSAYVRLPGVAGNFLSVPDAANLQITGDITLVARLTAADWSPVTQGVLAGKWAGGTGYVLSLQSNGALTLSYGAIAATTTVNLSATANEAELWLAATLDVDNGASGSTARFFTSADGVTWTLFDTRVTAGVATIGTNNAIFGIGANPFGVGPHAGRVHRVIVYPSIGAGGVPATTGAVLDVDTSVLTDEGATSFTATTGQTVTINRSTGATYKTEVVVPGTGSRLFNGTSDFGEVADLAGLDSGASDSFTVFALVRQWATFGTNDALVAKKADNTDTTQGWKLANGPVTAAQVRAEIGDGTNGAGCTTSASRTSGALVLASLIRNVTADTITAAIDGTLATAVTDATTGTLANSEVVRVGRLSGAGTEYTPMRVYAWGVFPGALTSAQLTALRTALIGTGRTTGTRTLDVSVPSRTLDISVPQRTLSISVPERTLDVSVPSRTLDISVPTRTLEISA